MSVTPAVRGDSTVLKPLKPLKSHIADIGRGSVRGKWKRARGRCAGRGWLRCKRRVGRRRARRGRIGLAPVGRACRLGRTAKRAASTRGARVAESDGCGGGRQDTRARTVRSGTAVGSPKGSVRKAAKRGSPSKPGGASRVRGGGAVGSPVGRVRKAAKDGEGEDKESPSHTGRMWRTSLSGVADGSSMEAGMRRLLD